MLMSLIRLLNNRVFTRAKRRNEKVRSGKREFLRNADYYAPAQPKRPQLGEVNVLFDSLKINMKQVNPEEETIHETWNGGGRKKREIPCG